MRIKVKFQTWGHRSSKAPSRLRISLDPSVVGMIINPIVSSHVRVLSTWNAAHSDYTLLAKIMSAVTNQEINPVNLDGVWLSFVEDTIHLDIVETDTKSRPWKIAFVRPEENFSEVTVDLGSNPNLSRENRQC